MHGGGDRGERSEEREQGEARAAGRKQAIFMGRGRAGSVWRRPARRGYGRPISMRAIGGETTCGRNLPVILIVA